LIQKEDIPCFSLVLAFIPTSIRYDLLGVPGDFAAIQYFLPTFFPGEIICLATLPVLNQNNRRNTSLRNYREQEWKN
jgi:hypothetical protein